MLACRALVVLWGFAVVPQAAFADAAPAVLPVASPAPSAAPFVAPTQMPAPEAPLVPAASPPPSAAVPSVAAPAPTAVPLTVSPSSVVLPYGSNAVVQTSGIYGGFVAESADPKVALTEVSQDARQIVVMGKGLGTTLITVRDSRGTTATIAVSVQLPAGRVAPTASIRITGAPASALFVAEQAMQAALAAAKPAAGANATVAVTSIASHEIDVDGISEIAVPVSIRGTGLYPVDGTTRVRVENFALPHVRPTSLLVSDFPELLREDGLLYTATLQPDEPTRVMFYHGNPAGQPRRWILLEAANQSTRDATISIVDGSGGPHANEMFAGHLATQRFLVREAQNEGVLVTVPAKSTVALVTRALPPGTVVNDILQLQEVSGPPLDLTLLAQQSPNIDASIDRNGSLLTDTVSHARGRYPIPEFFYDATYDVSNPQLEIPIGQLPLPNLREGVALAGDYGVLFAINATLINTGAAPAEVALYATPRGGRATGTFIIDRTLVQAHALPSYSHFKLRQYTVPAHGFLNVNVVTMPEGGSSYPLNLIFAPDDGSVGPGSPGSPVY